MAAGCSYTKMKKLLKEAGVDSSGLSNIQIKEMYEASQSPKNKEGSETKQHQNDTNNSSENNIENKDLCEIDDHLPAESTIPVKVEQNRQKNIEKRSPVKSYTFQDMIPSEQSNLEIIYHKPKYELSILHNPKYSKLPLEKKVQLLIEYHNELERAKGNVARQYSHMAKMPEPIYASKSCKTSLFKKTQNNEHLKHIVDSDENENEDEPEISHANDTFKTQKGRAVKRKTYTEDPQNDSDFEISTISKRHKNYKVFDDNNIDDSTKLTFNMPMDFDVNEFVDKTDELNDLKDKDYDPPNKKGKQGKSGPKSNKRKKISHADELYDEYINGDKISNVENENSSIIEHHNQEAKSTKNDETVINSLKKTNDKGETIECPMCYKQFHKIEVQVKIVFL